ncbi:MAG TPA: FMN-binding protein [Polyangia bacterium]|nr:FMN-binding protein [Polyangia bacterium]
MRDRIWFMVLVLGLVGGVAGLGLAAVRDLTFPVIEKRILDEKVKPTLETLFAPLGIDNDYIADRVVLDLGLDDWGRKIRLTVFVGRKGGAPAAVALQTAGGGYGGDIEVLTAFDIAGGKIIGVKTLAQKETKGLGARVSDDGEPFIKQFAGLAYEGGVKLRSADGEVDAISGATISSTGFTAAVDSAVRLLAERRAEILK